MSTITHVCLLDNDPIPAITPLIDKSIDSHGVIFAYLPEHKAVAERIEQHIKSRGIKVAHWLLPESLDVDTHIQSFSQLLEQHQEDELWLNASCGNRHTNLAAYEVFRFNDKPIFCVDRKTDMVSWLCADHQQNVQVSDSIKIRHYLEAYGATQTGGGKGQVIKREVLQLAERWAKQSKQLQYAIRALNYLAKSAETDQLLSEPMTNKQLKDSLLQILIDELIDLEYCQVIDNCLQFTDEESRFFANGGWLEVYTYSVIKKLRAKTQTMHDDDISVEVERNTPLGVVKNELDIAFLNNNKLYLIECKTKKFRSGEGNGVIYKLDSLVELLGGLQAKGMLVSYLPLAKYEKARAKDLGIEVVEFQSISQLEQRISHWIHQA